MMTVTSKAETIYKPSGISVEILSEHDEGEYKMVRSITTGKVFFAHRMQLEIKEQEEEHTQTNVKRRGRRTVVKTEAPAVPAEHRVNINTATPQRLTQVLKGVGLKTAMEIKELQQSMPGERFTKLDQLKSIGRVDWEAVLESGVVYVE